MDARLGVYHHFAQKYTNIFVEKGKNILAKSVDNWERICYTIIR